MLDLIRRAATGCQSVATAYGVAEVPIAAADVLTEAGEGPVGVGPDNEKLIVSRLTVAGGRRAWLKSFRFGPMETS